MSRVDRNGNAWMMRYRRGITMTEVLVVIGIIAILISILLPVLSRMRERSGRMKCPSNLRQIGTGLFLYAMDNDGAYPRVTLDRSVPISQYTGADDVNPFDGVDDPKPNDVTVPIFMLIRHMGILPEAFICPHDGTAKSLGSPVEGSNFPGRQSLSYSLQMPYPELAGSPYKWDQHMGDAQTAIAADMNPGTDQSLGTSTSPEGTQRNLNSPNHGKDGQMVLYQDGHVSWNTTPWAGKHGDNIYAPAPREEATTKPAVPRATTGYLPTHPFDSVLLPTDRD